LTLVDSGGEPCTSTTFSPTRRVGSFVITWGTGPVVTSGAVWLTTFRSSGVP
jgi:hypothetical protein